MHILDVKNKEKIIMAVICAIVAIVVMAICSFILMSSTTMTDFAADESAKSEAYNEVNHLLPKGRN